MRAEKQLLLEEIRERIAGGKSLILTRYQRLGANAATEFRRAVRKTGGEFEVMSKRLLVKAAERNGVSLNGVDLDGHIGVIIASEDAVAVSKVVFEFGKEREDAVAVIGGYIEGVLYDAEAVEKISKLPGLPEMRSQFLGLLEAPMAQTLAVLEALLTSVLYCLENKRKADETKDL